MKPLLKSPITGLTMIAFLLAGTAVVLSETNSGNPIDVTVSTDRHTAYNATIAKTSAAPETRTEKLKITLRNTTSQNFTDLMVRYCIFDKEVQNQKIAAALHDEMPVVLPAHATVTVTSKVASITFTPDHMISTVQRPAQHGAPATTQETPVKALGKESAGYGVEIRQTNTDLVVGQAFSPLERTNQFKTVSFGDKKKKQAGKD